MLDDALLSEMRKHGIDHTAYLQAWGEAAELLAAGDALFRAGGSNAIVKIDGGRMGQGQEVYTVVVSGGRLGETFYRKDGTDLRSLLREALSFYLTNADSASSGA